LADKKLEHAIARRAKVGSRGKFSGEPAGILKARSILPLHVSLARIEEKVNAKFSGERLAFGRYRFESQAGYRLESKCQAIPPFIVETCDAWPGDL
jgi:hypothetical protein